MNYKDYDEKMEKQSIEKRFFTRFQIIIGNAKKNGATEEELKTLSDAFFLARKYYFRKKEES